MPHWVRWLWLTIALLGTVYLAWRLIGLLLMLAIALLLTSALVPVVAWLDAKRLPHWLSVVTCLGALIGLVVGLVSFVGPLVAEQAAQLAANMAGMEARFEWLRLHYAEWRGQFSFLPEFSSLSGMLVRGLQGALETMIGLTGQFLTVAIGTFSVLFLAFFFLKDGGSLRRQVLALIPTGKREGAHEVLSRVTDRVGRYVLGVLANMIVVGTLTGIGLALLGVPYAAALGLLIGILDIIPFLGPFLGAFPGVLVAFGISWQTGLWAMAIYLGVQQLESYLTYPNVVGRAAKLHPAWIFLALLAGGELLGIAGMVLAVPTVVVAQIVLEEWYFPWVERHRRAPRLTLDAPQEALRFEAPQKTPERQAAPGAPKRPPGAGNTM
jgi:predicted PurR-regulated permease PerM